MHGPWITTMRQLIQRMVIAMEQWGFWSREVRSSMNAEEVAALARLGRYHGK